MNKKRKIADILVNIWMRIGLYLLLSIPVFIVIGLFWKAGPLLKSQSLANLLFSSRWSPMKGEFGFLPFIFSSAYVTVLAFLLSAPLCLFAAIYLTQFSKQRLLNFMLPVIDILAGIPSVVYGVWGILVIVPLVSDGIAPFFGTSSSGYSLLAGGTVLAVMCIPYMLNMLIEVFHTIPVGMKEASLSLGATSWEMVKHVILRKGFPGIISAFGLGISKAFGETIAVLMVVGNTLNISLSPLKPGYPLPALIANNYGEMMSIPDYDSALMFAALLLFVVILIINLFFRYFIHKGEKV
ncbi:phosphate ABC transporter permease subunit PstC [uncultured Draconibacterium sp.]|uniref:phosphate ABC transporter permease subunit PstC n=1 Tax=uncultured Draconibacterium sp. TaxID=1573823 RepID=UPI0025D48FE3|nr:phosphate ABC transporter permease subunit PstC [uncultured Draconibacterium sp.]